jgi:hypothetical protein
MLIFKWKKSIFNFSLLFLYTWFYITQPLGNNKFSYKKRKSLWSKAQIYVPPLIQWTSKDLKISNQISFEEVVNNKLISCKWLQNFVQIKNSNPPTFIIDNHNYALYFRYLAYQKKIISKNNLLIHIDQHSDMKKNYSKLKDNFTLRDLFHFTNFKTNVWNFISISKKIWLVKNIIQIRSDYSLNQIYTNFQNLKSGYILDIDIDFRQGKNDYKKDFKIIKKLISKASLITIATSPFFIDQKLAITITKKLISNCCTNN